MCVCVCVCVCECVCVSVCVGEGVSLNSIVLPRPLAKIEIRTCNRAY